MAVSRLRASSRARRTTRRLRRGVHDVAGRLGVQRIPAAPVVRVGVIETFGRPWIEGWVAVAPSAPPVQVELRVGRTVVATTRAADPVRRRVRGLEARRIRFPANAIWDYVKTADRLRVVADGVELPIAGHGTAFRPEADGRQTLADLSTKLEAGYVFGGSGWLQLSLDRDREWQRLTMTQCDRVTDHVGARFGVEPFFVYGTLLGAVRDNGPIGHDSDVDLAYISRYRTGPEAAAELRSIALSLIEAGHRVIAYRHHIRVAATIDGVADVHVDLFHTYFDADGMLRFPYGVAGRLDVARSDWAGVREIAFAGGRGRIPVCAELVVEALYGRGWREPQPGFNWDRDRRTAAREAWLSAESVRDVMWEDRYTHMAPLPPSSLCLHLAGGDLVPDTVIDLGCGDGADAFEFARRGHRVLGIDRSVAAVQAARRRSEGAVAGLLDLRVGDLGEPGALDGLVRGASDALDAGPVMFYARSLFDALSDDCARQLLETLAAVSRPGDLMVAEFAVGDDCDLPKATAPRPCRYPDGAAFDADLVRHYAFSVVRSEERAGLSPTAGADPVLHRVVARRE